MTGATKEKGSQSQFAIASYCVLIIAAFSLILIIPSTRTVFGIISGKYPLLMGFVKFGFLATVGELIASRIADKVWSLPQYIAARALIWGLLGILIAISFKIFGFGVSAILEQGIIPGGTGVFWKAFMTSLLCNAFFAPFMMGLHKMTDTYLDLKAKGVKKISTSDIAKNLNWDMFISFTMLKTLPAFWVPAHTVTFMLPAEYQIIMAAYLSIALGIILNLKKK